MIDMYPDQITKYDTEEQFERHKRMLMDMTKYFTECFRGGVIDHNAHNQIARRLRDEKQQLKMARTRWRQRERARRIRQEETAGR